MTTPTKESVEELDAFMRCVPITWSAVAADVFRNWPSHRDFMLRALKPRRHEEWVRELSRRVAVRACEIPDRDSPEDQPEMLLLTTQELRDIVEDEAADALSQPASVPAAPAEADAIIEECKAMLHKDAAANMPTLPSAVAWCRNEIDMLRGKLSPAQPNAVRQGFRLVPMVPTDAMMLACARAFQHAVYDDSDKFRDWRAAYRAALAAIPAPQSNDGPSTTAVDDQLRDERKSASPDNEFKDLDPNERTKLWVKWYEQALAAYPDRGIGGALYMVIHMHNNLFRPRREPSAWCNGDGSLSEHPGVLPCTPLYQYSNHAETAPSDSRLSGLRNEVLEEAAEECLRVWHDALVGSQQNGLSHGCVSSADAIRSLKTEAAQDQRGGTPSVLNGQVESPSVSNLPPLQKAAQPEAAVGSGICTEEQAAELDRIETEHCLPAAADDGPSEEEVATARSILGKVHPYEIHRCARAVLRWHAKKGGEK